jgi:hypothetical protein
LGVIGILKFNTIKIVIHRFTFFLFSTPSILYLPASFQYIL